MMFCGASPTTKMFTYQESCSKLLAPWVRRSWMTLTRNHPVILGWTLHEASGFILLGHVWQCGCCLIESPRHWSTGPTWAPKLFQQLQLKLTFLVLQKVKGWWFHESISHRKLRCKKSYLYNIVQFQRDYPVGKPPFLPHTYYSAFCIVHIYHVPVDLDPPMQRFSHVLTSHSLTI